MSGKISARQLESLLAEAANELYAKVHEPVAVTFDKREVAAILDEIARKAYRIIDADPTKVARRLLTEGGPCNGKHELASWFAANKIQAIKQIREESGSGLKEAKDAYERTLPYALREEAIKALKRLAEANRVAGNGYTTQVWAYDEDLTGAIDTIAF